MAFGYDDLIFAIISAVGSAAASSALQPDAPTNTQGGGTAGARQTAGGAGAFEQFIPQTTGPLETVGASPTAGIDLSAQSAVVDQAAKVLAAQGPPPIVPLQPAQVPNPPPQVGAAGIPQPGPIQPPTVPSTAPPPPQGKSIGEILAASPAALSAVANLLGLNPQPEGGTRPAPVAGGGLGSVVPGFQLPQDPAIGQLLAQIPRLR